jgi:hypothetical protein
MFDDDPESFVTEPRLPVPTPRDSAIALPEPDDFTADDSDLKSDPPADVRPALGFM